MILNFSLLKSDFLVFARPTVIGQLFEIFTYLGEILIYFRGFFFVNENFSTYGSLHMC